MYSLFNQPLVQQTRSRDIPRFERVSNHLKENLDRVISHYRLNRYSVRSDHLLVQLIQTLPIDGNTELTLLRNRIEDYAPDMARTFELTSPSHTGKSKFPGTFLGGAGPEVIILETTPVPMNEIRSNWEELSPVRFLRHPSTDLTMTPPDGRTVGNGKGPVVVLLNLPLLALQYRMWRVRDLKRNPNSASTTMHFISQYVLPNAIRSYVDISWFNIARGIYLDVPLTENPDEHPFYFNTLFESAVEGITDVTKEASEQKMGFAEFLGVYGPLTAETFQRALALPPLAKTRQVTPALILARLPAVSFMMHWSAWGTRSKDRDALNTVKRSVRQLRNMNFSQYGDNTLRETLSAEIDTHIRPFI